MSFCRDRQIRGYCLFLAAFVLVLFFLGVCAHMQQVHTAQELFLEHDRAVAESLLEQGISEDIIARAITNTSGAEAGEGLLDKIGITERTAVRFFPFLMSFRQQTGFFLLIVWGLLAGLLFAGTVLFFRSREQQYRKATQTILHFIQGDFSCHLTQTNEGAIYQFFAAVDHLATMLQSKNDIQEKAKEFLKDTISDISHQLKTPLAALVMYHEIIADEPENADTVKNYSEKAARALNRIELLIQSMLKITRLDAGSICFEKETCYISDLIAGSIRELTTRAEHEDKKILINGPVDEMVACDVGWTSEAIGNIVKNALDHTGAGGEIRISWERGPVMLRVCISDNGAGIAPEDIHHIFKRFYRSKQSLDTQGIGLGLPLAKSIIEGQGGGISVQSCLGGGTTFTLSFLTEL